MQSSDGSIGSPYPDVEIPKISLIDLLITNLNKCEENIPALIDAVTEKILTYGELNKLYRKISSALCKRGLNEGDVVCFFLPNCTEFVVMFLSCITAGAIVTLANSHFTKYEFKYQIDDSSASYIVTMRSHLPTVLAATLNNSKLRQIFVVDEVSGNVKIESFYDLAKDDGSAFRGSKLKVNPEEDTVVILYSSGTTGLPKGVELTHANFVTIYYINSQTPDMEIFNGSRYHNILSVIPFYHCYGLNHELLKTLMRGFTLVIIGKFNIDFYLKCIEKYRPVIIRVVPPIIGQFINYPLTKNYNISSIKVVHSGGAPLSKEVIEEFEKVIKLNNCVLQGYGMTEMTITVCRSLLQEKNNSSSSGKLSSNTRLKIVDLVTGTFCGANMKGEIWVKGPQMMKGYLNKPEATKLMITDDGWLKTGDIGYFDKDGCIYVIDRLKELIKYKAYQVAPAELEALLLTHPKIADVAVIGIPDKLAGEIPKAFIVKKNKSLTESQVHDFLKGKVSFYKQLKGGIVFVKSIPKSPSGKILRRLLRKQNEKLEQTQTMGKL